MPTPCPYPLPGPFLNLEVAAALLVGKRSKVGGGKRTTARGPGQEHESFLLVAETDPGWGWDLPRDSSGFAQQGASASDIEFNATPPHLPEHPDPARGVSPGAARCRPGQAPHGAAAGLTLPPACPPPWQVLIWNLDVGEPVKMIDCHSDVILCMSFNTDGSLLTTTCKDKKLRVIEPRSGRVLQVKPHRL